MHGRRLSDTEPLGSVLQTGAGSANNRRVHAALTPKLAIRPRPLERDSYEARYLRTFLWLRTLVGALGIALPVVLVLLATLAFGEGSIRGSLSAYYYSGARDELVAILSAIGVFFVGYGLAERSLENTLSVLAGAGAVVIAIFPTAPPSARVPTPLQRAAGEHAVMIVHFAASAVFLVSLMGISFLYGRRERRRPRSAAQTCSPAFWGRFHFACAALMAIALVWIVVTRAAHSPPHALLVGEWVSAWAFGASWLMKGLELDVLRAAAAT